MKIIIGIRTSNTLVRVEKPSNWFFPFTRYEPIMVVETLTKNSSVIIR